MKIYFSPGFVPESLKDQENSRTMHNTVAGAGRTQSHHVAMATLSGKCLKNILELKSYCCS